MLKCVKDGRLAAHSAVLWKLLGELELDLMVEGETQVLLLPGFTLDEVIMVNIHIVFSFIYLQKVSNFSRRVRTDLAVL